MSDMWDCGACTLKNNASDDKCTLCGAKRPANAGSSASLSVEMTAPKKVFQKSSSETPKQSPAIQTEQKVAVQVSNTQQGQMHIPRPAKERRNTGECCSSQATVCGCCPIICQDNQDTCKVFGFLLTAFGILLLITMLPSSFVYFSWDEMGFIKYTVTNAVNTDKTYETGQYYTGPFHAAVAFPATYQRVDSRLAIFPDNGQEFNINIVTFYRLDKEQLPTIYQEFGTSSFTSQIDIRVSSSVKSLSGLFALEDYINNRQEVMDTFFYGVDGEGGVRDDLASIGAILTIDKFWMDEVEIPNSIMDRNLDAAIQNEVNQMEENEREGILVELETSRQEAIILGNITRVQADAEASVQESTADADSKIVEVDETADGEIANSIEKATAYATNLLATTDGNKMSALFSNLNITDEATKTKYTAYFALYDAQRALESA